MVLVADDDQIFRHVMRAMLQRLGCEVEEVVNGAQAVQAARYVTFSLILMDCLMPVMNGLDAARAIRLDGMSRESAIVAVTSLDDWRACHAAGMNDFLRKPVRIGDLRNAVTTWTGFTRNGNGANRK